MNKFMIDGDQFLMNDEPFRIVSGAMHYFRVPREYWRDRLLKIKACGFNTVETYTAWNLHEPIEGTFDFSDNLDLQAYLDLIGELGMFAIVRPGPYICSEWEFGGLPWWLLRYNGLQIRCMNDLYLEKVSAYFSRLIPIIASRQTDCGGPVIMVQIENEYGSYGNDSAYIQTLGDMLETYGITCPLFTSDGASDAMLSGGTVDNYLAACNFGSKAGVNFKALRKFRGKKEPLMCAEFWNGWFDHWGERHHRRSAEDAAKELDEVLKLADGVSVYMMHGGTNFGWMNGANCSEEQYEPTVSSYDDDAPINEYGGLTEKYEAFRRLLAQYGHENAMDLPESDPPAAYPTLAFTECADLLDNLDLLAQPVETVTPLSMEQLGQGYGFICYTTLIKGPKEKQTLYMDANDRAYIFADGEFLGIYYRNDKKQKISLDVPEDGVVLTILVENMGRTNYGPLMMQRKGIVGNVRLGNQILYHWKTYCLPLDNLQAAQFGEPKKFRFNKRPQLLRASFTVEGRISDTFVLLPGFKKGMIFVNDRPLSRYWEIGPQHSAYLPAAWLKEGINTITVLELEGYKKTEVEFSAQPDIG